MSQVGETPVSLPSVVTINKELNNLVINTVKARVKFILSDLSEHYGLPQNELLSRYMTDAIKIESDEQGNLSKKVKKQIPIEERCLAKISNGELCSRRHRPGQKFCGGHLDSRPNGEMSLDDLVVNKTKPVITVKKVQDPE